MLLSVRHYPESKELLQTESPVLFCGEKKKVRVKKLLEGSGKFIVDYVGHGKIATLNIELVSEE
jgi:hypothetical protein